MTHLSLTIFLTENNFSYVDCFVDTLTIKIIFQLKQSCFNYITN